MKLPGKDDPGGDKEGQLSKAIVFQTLKDNGVSINDMGNDMYLLSQGDEVLAQVFKDPIGGLMIRRLSKICEYSTG